MKKSPNHGSKSAFRLKGRFLSVFFAVGAALLAFGVPTLCGQTPNSPKQGVTFWLLDDNGNWKVPLPNWSVDDVTALLDRTDEKHEITPFTILSLDINGEVTADRALMRMEYEIGINRAQGENSPVRIPLGMKEGVYRPESGSTESNFTAEGPGQVLLDVDPETGGYAVLVYPDPEIPSPSETSVSAEADRPNAPEESAETPADVTEGPPTEEPSAEEAPSAPTEPPALAPVVQNYTVRLNLLFPVLRTAGSDEQVLTLTPPPTVSSQARMVVPLPDVEISASEGVIASAPVNLDEKSSEINVYGFNRGGTATVIRWRPAEKNEAALPTTYRVENATIDLTPTGDGIEYEVRLPIRVFGGSQFSSMRVLRVDLPIGARPDMQNIRVTDGKGGEIYDATCREIAESEVRPLPAVEVSIPSEIDSLVLSLAAFVPTGEENKWECTGFHLEGAQKETGEIIVHLPDDEDILPGLVPGTGVRDIDQPETADEGDKTARFRFYKEPFSLKSDPIPRQTHLIAQPEFQIQVSSSETRLKARVAYSAYGAPLRSVRVKREGWLFAHFDDESGIDSANIYDDPETGETILPLKKPVEGEFVLVWESVRDLDGAERNNVNFGLPEIVAEWIASPILAVVPDDNIELLPLTGGIRGLTERKQLQARLAIGLPQREQPPLLYQIQKEGMPEGEKPHFSARYIVHTGDLLAKSTLAVQLDRTPAELVQTIEYHAKFVPVQTLDFLFPQTMDPLANQEILLNGKPVTSELLSVEKDKDGNDISRRSIRLPAPGMIGVIRLEFRATFELPTLSPDQTSIVNIPLAVPIAGTLEGSSAEVTAPLDHAIYVTEADSGASGNVAVNTEGEDRWKETTAALWAGIRRFGFSSGVFPQWFPLRATVDKSTQGTEGLTAEYIWAQTFFGDDSYFERIRCRISGNLPTFTLRLPEGARKNQIAIRVDGSTVPVDCSPDERTLRIPLPERAKTETTLVQIEYLIHRNGHELEFPDLMGQTMVRRCDLQLILPRNTHLRRVPEGWSSEHDRFIWSSKTPKLAESMKMITEEDDDRNLVKNANVYLLSSFDPPQRVHIHLVSHTAVVLLGSGMILLFGVLYVYVPHFRYVAWVLFPFALPLAVLWFRASAVLFCLTPAAVGLLLIMVVLVLKRQVERRKYPAPTLMRSVSLATMDRSRSASSVPKPASAKSKTEEL
jgi:hypothetical protein